MTPLAAEGGELVVSRTRLLRSLRLSRAPRGCSPQLRRCGRGTGMSAGQVARLGEVSGSERVVMVDIDGGLADLSAFTHLLTRLIRMGAADRRGSGSSTMSDRRRWSRRVGIWWRRWPVWDSWWSIPRLGPSRTRSRPGYGSGENGFPPSRALLCRARNDLRTGRRGQGRSLPGCGAWLSAFVDDEPETVDALRSGGVRAACVFFFFFLLRSVNVLTTRRTNAPAPRRSVVCVHGFRVVVDERRQPRPHSPTVASLDLDRRSDIMRERHNSARPVEIRYPPSHIRVCSA